MPEVDELRVSDSALLAHDRARGVRLIAGVDEVGAGGCWAGPIMAAGVLFDLERLASGAGRDLLEEVNDSKRLAPAKQQIASFSSTTGARTGRANATWTARWGTDVEQQLLPARRHKIPLERSFAVRPTRIALRLIRDSNRPRAKSRGVAARKSVT
jgi:hypothetical protein